MTVIQSNAGKRRIGNGSVTSRKKTFWLTTMMLPGAIWLLLIRYLPMFGIVIAFKNYRAFRPNTFWNNIVRSEWVGLKNFERFFNSAQAWPTIRNTLVLSVYSLVAAFPVAVTVSSPSGR